MRLFIAANGEPPTTPWKPAAEAVRCIAMVKVPVYGILARCDLERGHDGDHQYLSAAGAVVSFRTEP